MQRLTFGLAVALAASCAASAADAPPPPATGQSRPAVKLQVPGTPAIQLQIGKEQPKAPDPIPLVWSDAEIAAAKARCDAILKDMAVVAIPEPAFRTGSCGAAAPMRLISIGRDPEVALSPPPVLTCEMIAGLEQWLRKDVQPLARKHLGESVIKIETMSDYSCRAAYGRKGNRLSEHGRANALDIRSFVTSKGQVTAILAEWGKTQRDVRRELAAAKAAAEKAEQIRLQAEAAAAAAKAGQPAPAATQPAIAKPHIAIQTATPPVNVEELAQRAVGALTGIVKGTISDDQPGAADTGHALAPPSRLGGPTAEPAPAVAAPAPQVVVGKRGRFLRDVHAAACRIFGTTLGPEANEAHRNHLHVDMAVRDKLKHFCE
jgi:hypothetical protein